MKSLLFLSGLTLIACNKDTDGDGLTDRQEADFGSDPEKVDSDNDGLTDAEEFDYSSDPNSSDSDGDGYLDLWEANEGSDPADADDRIYVGNWPYNPDKDSYDAPTERGDYSVLDIGAMDEGAPCLRSQLLDQFGDQVDLYDFTGQGKYIAVDISAMWCPPCKDLADAIAKGDTGAGWGKIPDLVHNGDIYWLTILAEDNRGNIPDVEDLQKWYNDYPDDNVPVLADTEGSDYTRLYASFFPTILVFDENLNYVQGPEPDIYDDEGNLIEQHSFDGLIWLNNNF